VYTNKEQWIIKNILEIFYGLSKIDDDIIDKLERIDNKNLV
jgi:hypothetical protein